MNEIEQLEKAIETLETQRAILGDDVVDTAVAPLREKLMALRPSAAAEQRKLVTILFADLVGFTALAERLDPEDVREVLDVYFKSWTACIEGRGGQVEKYIGDAVMAVFGLQSSREDDPESAIHAALDMRLQLAKLNEEFERTRGLRLSVRVGINTGPVVVSFLGERKGQAFVIVGDTVNLASRLQTAAPADGILISHDTYRHIRGLFAVQPQPPLKVKGKSELVQVYVIEWAKQRGFRMMTRGIEGIETRTIGREAEIQQLKDCLTTTMNERERQVITIAGDAGMGKSRLMYEFDNYMELLPVLLSYLKGRSLPSTQSVPYALLRDLFSFRFRLQDSDPPAVVQEKWERGFLTAFDPDNQAKERPLSDEAEAFAIKSHFVGHLLGFDFRSSPHIAALLRDAKGLHDRAVTYLADYFKTLTARLPVVLLLEDIHWADDASLDLITDLARTMADQRLLIVCTARPTLYERRPDWGAGLSYYTRLDLQPLSRRDSRRLVGELLQKVEVVPVSLSELLVSNAEGNPFYLEELIKMFLDDGVILKGENHWVVDESRLASARVPPTLTGVLQARFDSLRLEERVLLQRASVIGRIFWDGAVEYLGDQEPGPAGRQIRPTPELFTSLQRREMVYQRDPSSFDNTHEYLFKTTLLRDVTYESLLKRERRLYHAHAARWLEQVTQRSQRADEYAPLIADHYEHAGELNAAALWYERAGLRAVDQFTNADAIRYLSRALELAPPEAQAKQFTLLLAREKVYNLLGNRAAQASDLALLLDLADALGPVEQAEVFRRKSIMEAATGDYPGSLVSAEQAIHLAQKTGAREIEALAYLARGMAFWKKGDYPGAQSPLEQALEIARQEGYSWVEVESLRNLGVIYEVLGDYTKAHYCFEHALKNFRKMGDRRGESMSLNSLGLLSYSEGKFLEARNTMEISLRIKREIGDRRGEETTLHNLGMVSYCMADPVHAREFFQQAFEIAVEVNDPEGVATCSSGLGAVAIFSGDFEVAREELERALRVFREMGDAQGESESLTSLGLLMHLRGEDSTAYEYGHQAYSLALDLGVPNDQGRALNIIGHAALNLNRLEEAETAYQKSLSIRQNLDQKNLSMEPMAGLIRLHLAKGEILQALKWAEAVMDHLSTEEDGFMALYGVDEPARIVLSVIKAFQAAKDYQRAEQVGEPALQHIIQRSEQFQDRTLRRYFLENVPAHREFISLKHVFAPVNS